MNDTISFFDLDHTLLRVNCSFHFGLYLYRKKMIGLSSLFQLVRYYLLHKGGFLGINEIHEKSFESLFRGSLSHEFRDHGKAFVDLSYDRLINLRLVESLFDKQSRGERVVILSSSPDFLVEAFAERFGVSSCFATIYQTDDAGRYCDIQRVLEGGEKSKLVKQIIAEEGISFENTFGYSDSHHDLEFLESVAVPIAVNPNRMLRKICEERDWQVFAG